MIGSFSGGRSAVARGLIGLAACLSVLLVGAGSASAAPVSTGHSGWFWGSPQPQGNALTDLDFIGARGYAVGGFGTLLRTEDAGASWTGLRTGLTDGLSEVQAVDANTVIVAGACALRRSGDAGESFARLPWTASDEGCPSGISSFHFPSSTVGYVTTVDGSVFRTADGGQTFSRQTSIPGATSGAELYFTSETTGVAVTKPSGGGKIFRTTDSGVSWNEVASPGFALEDVTFVTANDGFAVGGNGGFVSTVDGGVTWSPQPLTGAPPQLLQRIDCADVTTCLAVGANGHLVRTTDAGLTATEITPSTSTINAVAFSSATRVVAVGSGGATVVSDDGGVNYSRVGGGLGGATYGRLRASSPQIANAGTASGTLARTIDGGVNWFTVGVPTTGTVVDASFPDANAGYAIDHLGGAFKTTNGGTSWQILETGASEAPGAILALDPQTVLIVGPTGIRRSTDGGSSFSAVDDRDLRGVRLVNAEPAGTGALVAWGREAVRTSTNGGATWKRVKLPRKVKVLDASFAGASAGFVLTRDERLLRTRNAGREWKEMPAIGTDNAYGISFSSARSGFAVVGGVDTGYLLHTTNGGASWQPQLTTAHVRGDVYDAGATAFSRDVAGSFFATNTGGDAATPTALTLKQSKGRGASRAKAGKVKVAGTLSPAEGGEEITVAWRDHKGRWQAQTEIAATDGRFTSAFKIKRPTVVVASWFGDDTRGGAGTKAVSVSPPKRR